MDDGNNFEDDRSSANCIMNYVSVSFRCETITSSLRRQLFQATSQVVLIQRTAGNTILYMAGVNIIYSAPSPSGNWSQIQFCLVLSDVNGDARM